MKKQKESKFYPHRNVGFFIYYTHPNHRKALDKARDRTEGNIDAFIYKTYNTAVHNEPKIARVAIRTRGDRMEPYEGLTLNGVLRAQVHIMPLIQTLAAEMKTPGEFGASLVVLDPRQKYRHDVHPSDNLFRTEIAFYRHNLEKEKWPPGVDFLDIALNKAYISWKTGLPSSVVQQQAPYLYSRGMTKWGGSAVGLGGLVVAFSGLSQEFDEMIAEMMISAIKAECRYAMRDVMASDSHFIGGN